MKKIVVEIDGQRYRLVKGNDTFSCRRCSLLHECNRPICFAFGDINSRFVKEEEDV